MTTMFKYNLVRYILIFISIKSIIQITIYLYSIIYIAINKKKLYIQKYVNVCVFKNIN